MSWALFYARFPRPHGLPRACERPIASPDSLLRPQTFQLGSVWATTLKLTATQTRSMPMAAREVAGSVAASLSAEALPRELRRKELPPVPAFTEKPTVGGERERMRRSVQVRQLRLQLALEQVGMAWHGHLEAI